MKAIGIKIVELQPMRASIALQTGYKIGNAHPDDMGYEVTCPDGYKSWSPKDVADQFVNTWNHYVEPKEEIKDEVGEVHD